MEIEIEIEDPRWEAVGLAALAERAARQVLEDRGIDPALCRISVLACDDARIAELNAEYREKPKPTNVLSWPAEERGAQEEGADPEPPAPDVFGEIELGDLAIAFETCAREAEQQGKALADHVLHLLIHATLHLLGYDHIRDKDAEAMEQIEIRLLESVGIRNPYM